MSGKMPEVYEGDRPYIFVSYAHADRDAALPMIAALVDEGYRVWYDDGYRVWYDDGIEPVVRYSDYLADHVYDCTCFVALISRASITSDWCRDEIEYALDLKKKVLPIHLEDVNLPRGLQMRVGCKQTMFWYRYDTDEAFYRELCKARMLEVCLADEGRVRRGVKPRGVGFEAAPAARVTRSAFAVLRVVGSLDTKSETAQATGDARQTHSAEQEEAINASDGTLGGPSARQRHEDVGEDSGSVCGVGSFEPKKGGLDVCSWAEVKEIPQLIAMAFAA